MSQSPSNDASGKPVRSPRWVLEPSLNPLKNRLNGFTGSPFLWENSLESNLRNSENPAIYQRSSAIPGIRRGVRLHNLKATPEWVISDRADHPCRDRPLQTQGAAQDQHWFSHLKTV
jgi:hypothetical protein